jgi:hypothetical protein
MNRLVQENGSGRCAYDGPGPDKPVRKSVKLSGETTAQPISDTMDNVVNLTTLHAFTGGCL